MKTLIAPVLLCVGLGACASITRGTTEPVAFVSNPPGAAVTTTKGYACPITPCSLEVGRSDEFDATFTKPGYLPHLVQVKTQVVNTGVAGFAGNILAGGVIGMGVDAATGAAMNHEPNPVIVNLELDRAAASPPVRRRRPARPAA